jgi:phosphatidylglycerol---prolipoprotein diacylglyceryl transferase
MLPTYMLVLSMTYCIALLYAYYRSGGVSEKLGITLDLALAIMIGGFLGARLFHIFYELPEFYLNNPAEMIKFWRGGFVYYGGFIGAFLACAWYVHRYKLSFLLWADFFAPILSLGYAIGRIGCFLNGCCYGAVCSLPWAVEFSHPGLPLGLRHPTQLYATAYEFIVFLCLLAFERSKYRTHIGQTFFIWLGLHGGGRILMEAFRDDDRGLPVAGLSISTWISLILVMASVVGLLRSKKQPAKIS